MNRRPEPQPQGTAMIDYAVVFNVSSNGMAITHADSGKILDVNATWIRSVGIRRHDAVGRTALELGVWANLEERSACLAEFEMNGAVKDFEARLMLGSKPVPHLISGQVVDLYGVPHILWEFRDIGARVAAEIAVRNLNAELAATLQAIPDLLFHLTEGGVYVNAWARDPGLLVTQKETFLGHSVTDVLPAEAAEAVMSAIRIASRDGYAQGQVIQLELPHGMCWFELSTAIKPEARAKEKHFMMLSRNITDRKLAEQQLAEEKRRFRDFSESTADWFWEMDGNLRFNYFSDNFEGAYGLKPEALLGLSRADLLARDQLNPQTLIDAHLGQLQLRQPFRNFEYCIRDRSGGIRWVSVSGVPFFDLGGNFAGYRGVGQNITERKRAEAQIHQLAYFDTLTGLPNRRLLLDRLGHDLDQAKRYHRALAVMFLDLDGFKQVNDTHGHDIGDKLLQQIGSRLGDCIRKVDTVARTGGDEFVVVLPEIAKADDAIIVAEKIIDSVREPAVVDGLVLRISTSIGIAVYPVDSIGDVQDIMKKADIAMYAAKQDGRNRYRLHTVM